MLLTEKKKGVSQNGHNPSIIGICSYCVLDMPVFERCQTLLHPELTPWWSFLLADGAHYKKPHSPTHPPYESKIAKNEFDQLLAVKYNKVTRLRWNSNSTYCVNHLYLPIYPISNWYLKACWKKVQKTDGWTDGHCHSIMRPFFKVGL